MLDDDFIWNAEQRRDLDRFCLPLLHRRATPSSGELVGIVNRLELAYPSMDRKRLLSKAHYIDSCTVGTGMV